MRRVRRRKKQVTNKTIFIVLFVLLILIGTGYSLLSQPIDIER